MYSDKTFKILPTSGTTIKHISGMAIRMLIYSIVLTNLK